ncbi:MAG: permease, partial [Methanobacteriota archaeon]
MSLLLSVLKQSTDLWMAIAPFLLLGMLIAGMFHVLLRQELIARHLGRGSLSAVLKATLLGIPLPLCS